MRDMILVERVTDGERCEPCPLRSLRGNYETLWCPVFDCDVDNGKRCADCLATPSAVVLTPEMMGAVEEAAEMFEDQEWPNYAQKLRAAFPQIEGVGR